MGGAERAFTNRGQSAAREGESKDVLGCESWVEVEEEEEEEEAAFARARAESERREQLKAIERADVLKFTFSAPRAEYVSE